MKFGNAIRVVKQAGRILLKGFGLPLELTKKDDRSQRDTDYDSKSLEIICRGLLKYYPQDGLMGEGLEKLAPVLEIGLNNHGILCGESGKIWIIDPLCGSIPFSRGIPDFIVSVAYAMIEPLKLLVGIVFDPVRNELFYAEYGKGSYLNGRPISVSTTDLEKFKNQGMISIEHKMIRENKYSSSVITIAQKVARLRVAGTCGLELAYVAAGRLDAVLKAKQPLYDYAAGLIILQEARGMATDFTGSQLRIELNYQKISDILASNGKIHQMIIDDLRLLKTAKDNVGI